MTGGRRHPSTLSASPTPVAAPAAATSWSPLRLVGGAAAAVAVIAVVATLGAGAASRPDEAATIHAAAPVPASRDDAATLLARGDYAGAEAAYRERVRSAPSDVAARYALGIALSHLDRAGETREQFEWIVANAKPGQKEVTDALRWLEGMTPAAETREARPADAALTPANATGSLKGLTQWPGITPETKRTKLELRLVGDEPAVESTNIKIYISLGAPYRFTKLRPGRYRLVGRTDTQELWNANVTVDAGGETAFDLTQQNSAVTPEPAAKS